MPSLRMNILTGHASPASLEWIDGPSEVRIGREAGLEVRLDPERDTAVSRGIHARLVAIEGGWALECLHASGLGLLDPAEQRVVRRLDRGERTPIGGRMCFELGVGGPRLEAIDASAPLPATELGGDRPQVVPHVRADVIAKAESSWRRVRLLAGLGVGALVIVVMAIVLITQAGRRELEASRDETRDRIRELQQASAVQQSTLAAAIGTLKSDIARVEEAAVDRMDEVLGRVAKSVWLVGVEDSNGFTPIGTAWTAADGVLMTNAHVAESLDAQARRLTGARRVARGSAGNSGSLLLADGIEAHPAYGRWNGLLDQFVSKAGGSPGAFSIIHPGDVALLRVERGDSGTPLTLPASERGDSALKPGTVLGYVGYPMEGVAGIPTAQAMVGRLSAITDFFFGEDRAGENLLLHYTGVIAGGASGSPLVNNRGEVVGIVCAGSMLPTADASTRISMGINYAQGVDLARELLEGRAVAAQDAREGRWKARLRDCTVSSEALLEMLIAQTAQTASEAVEPVGERTVTLTATGAQGIKAFSVRLEPGYVYIIASVSSDWTDIDLIVASGGAKIAEDVSADWYPVVVLKTDSAPSEAQVVVFASPPLRSDRTDVIVRVCRAPVGVFPGTVEAKTGTEPGS